MLPEMGRWLVACSLCLIPSALLAADNAKLIADGKKKLTAFREAEKQQTILTKQAEIAAVTAGEIDENLPVTFLVTSGGKWKFQKEGHQLSELKRLHAELQKINDSNVAALAPALNLLTMKKGDVGRIELTQPNAFRLTELKATPWGKDAFVVSANLDQRVNQGWRFTKTQRSFSLQGIDVNRQDYAKDIFVCAGTTKIKRVTMPRLICIEQFVPSAQ